LLDQLASFSDGPVTAGTVRELLGSVGADVLLEATGALSERRSADALRLLDRLSNEGKDLSQFAGELLAHLRRLMLLPDVPEVALAEVGAEEQAGLEEQAGSVGVAESVRMISALGDALSRMKRGGDAKLELELTFLKLIRDYEEPSIERLFERLEALEKAVVNGAPGTHAPQALSEPAETPLNAEAKESPESAGAVENAPPEPTAGAGRHGDQPETDRLESDDPSAGLHVSEAKREDGGGDGLASSLRGQWVLVEQDLKARKKALTAAYLKEGQARPVGFEDGVLTIAFSQEQAFFVKEIDKPQHREALEEVLEERLGVRPRLQFEVDSGYDAGSTSENASTIGSRRPLEGANVAPPEPDLDKVPEEEYGSSPGPEARSVAPGSRDAGAEGVDGTIESPREALEMAWDLFRGPSGGSSRENQSGGV
jgi:DNA polymerase-3 subunit gamma/tau